MTTPDLLPDEVRRSARRAGLPLDDARLAQVAATADHIRAVTGVLRALDFGETAPATASPATRAEEVTGGAAV